MARPPLPAPWSVEELDAQYAIVGCDKRRWLRELDRAPASKDGETGAAIFFHNMPLERD